MFLFQAKDTALAVKSDAILPANRLSTKKDFSDDERKQLAKQGAAMSDGSYPITNADDLEHAIGLSGSSKTHSKDEVQSHIKSRAKALGLTAKLPDSWTKKYERPITALSVKSDLDRIDPILGRFSGDTLAQKRASKKPLGGLVSKSAFALDPHQSNPANTDTMEEDPTVDMFKPPKPYMDVIGQRAAMLPGAKLQSASTFGRGVPMNAAAITASLTPSF